MAKKKSVPAAAVAAVVEKDEEELELEKLVFGDAEGFEAGLRDLTFDVSDDESLDEEEAAENEEVNEDFGAVQDDNLFFVDDGEPGVEEGDKESDDDSEDSDSDSSDVLDVHGGTAAWADSDDEKLQVSLLSSDKLRKLRRSAVENGVNGHEYSQRLRSRFQKMYPVPQWALPEKVRVRHDSDDSEDEAMDVDDENSEVVSSDPLAKLLQTQSQYTSVTASTTLRPSTIDISRLKDANAALQSKSGVQTLHFHPTHPLLLSSGYDRTLRIYYIDGRTNPVASSLHVRSSPFQTAQFHKDGRRVFAGGRRRNLYIWDIETGKVETITRMYGHEQQQRSMEKFLLSPCGLYVGLIGGGGWLNVLSATTGQWIAGAKIEGVIADFAWHHDGKHATIISTSGDVWQWDSVARKFSGRWKDEGAVGITSIALGGKNDRWCAIGSNSGIVNVYDTKNPTVSYQLSESEAPVYKPRVVLDQLVTTISSLEFSPDGQILVMASRAKKDALRLVHVPSFTVFKNWPTSGTPLGRVTSVAFTPGTQMLCTANHAGRARLWRLNHY